MSVPVERTTMTPPEALDDLTDDEETALEAIERGFEEVHRAHGQLIGFHHAVGSAMDHFRTAAAHLEDADEGDLAAALRDDILPAGVTADGKLSYEVVSEFESGLHADATSVVDAAFDELGDGRRYPLERRRTGADD